MLAEAAFAPRVPSCKTPLKVEAVQDMENGPCSKLGEARNIPQPTEAAAHKTIEPEKRTASFHSCPKQGNDSLHSRSSGYRKVATARWLLSQRRRKPWINVRGQLQPQRGAISQPRPKAWDPTMRRGRRALKGRDTYVAACVKPPCDSRCPALTGLVDLIAATLTQGVALGFVISPLWGALSSPT